jgi:hypothetical protein
MAWRWPNIEISFLMGSKCFHSFFFIFFLFIEVKNDWIKSAKLCWRNDKKKYEAKMLAIFFPKGILLLLFLFVLIKLFLYLLIHPITIFLFDFFFAFLILFCFGSYRYTLVNNNNKITTIYCFASLHIVSFFKNFLSFKVHHSNFFSLVFV